MIWGGVLEWSWNNWVILIPIGSIFILCGCFGFSLLELLAVRFAGRFRLWPYERVFLAAMVAKYAPPKKTSPQIQSIFFPPLWGVWKTLGNLSTHTVGRWILTRVRVCAAEWIENQSDLGLKPPFFSSYKTWVDQTDFWKKTIGNTNDLAKAPWNPHLHKKTKTFLERGSGVTKWRSSAQNWLTYGNRCDGFGLCWFVAQQLTLLGIVPSACSNHHPKLTGFEALFVGWNIRWLFSEDDLFSHIDSTTLHCSLSKV